MNKTISINLGGNVFNIEEDAFHMLRAYLESIKANFTGDPASEEIMQDIEVRISELFNERMNERKNVVIRLDVDHVIAIMGRPEDYKMAGDDTPSHDFQTNPKHRRKRLFRDEDEKVVGGVCAGIAHYLGIDVTIMRIIVAVLFFVSFGTVLLGYILFWALVPKAETTTEKLQMRGEPITVGNISRLVNDEARAASVHAQKFGRKAADQFRAGSSQVASGVGRALAILFGFLILMMGFGLLIGLLSMLIISDVNFFGFGGDGLETVNNLVFENDGTLWMLVAGGILTMGAPAIALMYLGVRLLTGSGKRIKGLGIALLSLFIIGSILSLYGGIKTAKQFSHDSQLSNSTMLSTAIGDTLHIEVLEDTIFPNRSRRNYDIGDLIKITPEYIYYGQPVRLEFEPTTDDAFKVQVRRSSQGRKTETAHTLCRNIDYNYTVHNDTVSLNSYLTTLPTDNYRGQEVVVTIYVPRGKYVEIGKNVHWLTWQYEEDEGKVLRMYEDKLEEVDEPHKDRANREREAELHVTDDSLVIRTHQGEIKVRH